jgi:hypothetical protein
MNASKPLKSLANTFFADKEVLLVGIKNVYELRHRLKWLSEGSLRYHIKREEVPHGGSAREIALYQKWVEFLAEVKNNDIKRCAAKEKEERSVRHCSCGGKMVPHHRQTHDDCTWLVCSNLNCDATAMIPTPGL